MKPKEGIYIFFFKAFYTTVIWTEVLHTRNPGSALRASMLLMAKCDVTTFLANYAETKKSFMRKMPIGML